MSTMTSTRTNTYVYARHIAAKVSADLKRLQRLYGINSPSDWKIDAYEEELQLLLNAGYLDAVIYGYMQNGKWIMALKYKTIDGGVSGSNPGGMIYERDISGFHFSSFLSYSMRWRLLSKHEKECFEETLPLQRVDGTEPSIEKGSWAIGRSYTAGELGVQRSAIKVN